VIGKLCGAVKFRAARATPVMATESQRGLFLGAAPEIGAGSRNGRLIPHFPFRFKGGQMAVFQRHIFEDPAAGNPSGNAASQSPQTDPWTGRQYGAVDQHTPEPSPWPNCRQDADGATQAKLSALETESRRATGASSKISSLDSGACGLALNFGGNTSPGTPADDYDAASLRRFGEVNPGGDHGSGGIAIGGQS
jgi:hypothetical protein